MTFKALLDRFASIRVNNQGGKAPHKPLVLLYALARVQTEPRLLSFRDINEPLKGLVEQFGPKTVSYQVVDPFWRLKNDKGLFWEVRGPEASRLREIDPPSEQELIDCNAEAGFTKDVHDDLCANPMWVLAVADLVLRKHSPEGWSSEEVYRAVGLNPNRTR